MFELFIARRYLRAKRKQAMISVITVISIIGVAAGVMALVVALAITNGFSQTLERNFLGATAHVMIREKTAGPGIENWHDVAAKLAQIPHVKNVTPALYDYASINGTNTSQGATIKAISPGGGTYLPSMLARLKDGTFSALNNPSDPSHPGIILGSRLAQTIGAVVNKPVKLLILNGAISPMGPRPTVENVWVVGIFESGAYELDSGWAYMSLADTQRIFSYGDVVNAIELNLDDIYQAPDVAKAAEALLAQQPTGKDLSATTWQEQNRPLLNALKLDRIGTAIVIGLMEVIAAMIILVALVMMVMEKHRDVAILMSMGAKASQIRRIFIYEGAMIGGVGTIIGLALGYLLCALANHYKWLTFDADVYTLSYVPLEPHTLDAIWISASAMLVSFLATLYPANSAAKISPVDSMRYE